MRIIIEAEIDGETRPGVLADDGGGFVAVFAGRVVSDGRALGPVRLVDERPDAKTLHRIRVAGFRVAAKAGRIQGVWAGPVDEA